MKRLVIGMCALCVGLSIERPARAQDTSSSSAISTTDIQQLVRLDTTLLAFLRRRNARDYAIAMPNGVQEDRYITLGGIEQWISIRGEDRNNPVLLLVHGGPGDATSLYGCVPVFVFQGADDLTTPTSLAESFVRSIRAPKKKFVPIPGAGHFALFTRPDAFLDDLVTYVDFAR